MKKQEEEKEAVVIRFGDELNLYELFRIKGRPGLYTLRSGINKSGMVGVMSFLDYNNTAVIHKRYLECLGELLIDCKPKAITLNDLFSNLFDYQDDGNDLEKQDINTLMDVMAPNYTDNFKISHAEKCLKWYKLITQKLKEYEEDAAKNKTEDKK